MMESRSIKMKIRSSRYDVEESLFSILASEGEEDELSLGEQEISSEEEIIEISTEGAMNITEKRIELEYMETELSGMEGSRTLIAFETDKCGLVTMTREGAVSTSLVFENGKRHHCVYQTPYMPFEICVRTIKVENEILKSGTLRLDYIIEIRGARAERTKFELKIVE